MAAKQVKDIDYSEYNEEDVSENMKDNTSRRPTASHTGGSVTARLIASLCGPGAIEQACQTASKKCWTACCDWKSSPPPKIDKRQIVVCTQPLKRSDSENSLAVSSPRDKDRRGSSSSHGSDATLNSFSYRRSSVTPVIDMKPIEFWANRETVQPRTPRRGRLPSEPEFSIDSIKPDLYEVKEEVKKVQPDLGEVHVSLQYEVPANALVVRIIEARHLPLPASMDRADQAHSNPYAKIYVLPDTKNAQQTGVQRKTQDPKWGDTFTFEMSFQDAQKGTLHISVRDFDKFSRHCVIGHVNLPLDSMNLLKGGHLWKALIPSHLDKPDIGELLLSLLYIPSAGRLSIDVIKAKQLLQTDLVGGSDPFVKITLLNHEKPVKTKKTSMIKNTIDPVFNENITFTVGPESIDSTSLVITVWDYNSKSKDDLVGRIVIGKHSNSGRAEGAHWNKMMQCQRQPVAQWHSLHPKEICDRSAPISATIL